MDIIYFLVTSLEAYSDKYGFHENYFLTEGGFIDGLIYSSVVGAAIALVFYLVLCNGRSVSPATTTNWCIGLGLVLLGAYFLSDALIIGSEGNPGTGFYESCQSFANDFMINQNGNDQAIQDCQLELNTIMTQLSQGEDVDMWFNITNAIIAVLVYLVVSFVVRSFTKHGSAIPF